MKSKLFAVIAIGMLALGSIAISASTTNNISEDCPLGCCAPSECTEMTTECN